MISRRHAATLAAAVAASATAAVAVAAVSTNQVGPRSGLLGNGRLLRPAGRLSPPLGNFPTGAALTPDGRFYWTVSTGRGRNDVCIVAVATRRVVQILPVPGASGGVAMDPKRRVAYVSGVADSGHADQARPGLPGRDGDVIHVFSYAAGGRAAETGTIAVPPPASATVPQAFPPLSANPKNLVAWPDRLAVAPDGSRLLVPLNLADAAAIVDTATRAVRYVPTGDYPYGAAITRNGRYGLVSNEAPGTVSVIDLAAGTKVKDIKVGAQFSHPEGIALDPKADRAYVAIANSDQVAVLDTKALRLLRTLSVERPQGLGTSPVDVAVTPDGTRLWVAEAGGDELAAFALPAARRPKGSPRAWSLIGRIPTAEYPAAVVATPAAFPCDARRGARCSKLVWLAAKGLGVGPNPRGPNPESPRNNDNQIGSFQYLPLLVTGRAGVLDLPSDARIRALTPAASRQITPSNAQRPPKATPLRAGGPIKYVFYVVRENRTYDQILGDVSRGDGDRKLSLFGRAVTPNFHALVDRFPLLDHVFANSEASIDGHFWASAGAVSDYVHKNWFQNYADRKRPYDFGVYGVTWPGSGFLFDQAERQKISYFNYGEAVAGVVPKKIIPDKDVPVSSPAGQLVERKFEKSDLGNPFGCYPNDAYIGRNAISGNPVWDTKLPAGAESKAESRYECFEKRFQSQLAANAVPRFTYLTLTSDHTNGTDPGRRTPKAMIADNDDALGRIVDLVSHSKIWRQSAIFVIEDDSQDGADHVDAHRIPAAVISPFAKRRAVIHTRYDFLSVIRSMELILGMRPLGLADRLATPMYDAFDTSARNAAPYALVPPQVDLLARNPATAANARLSHSLNLDKPDQVTQHVLDRILWQSVHGRKAAPPPPGPNAVAERDADG